MDADTLARLAEQAYKEAPLPDPRFPPSAYYRFLRRLAEAVQPNLSVELGVCGGGASYHLALGWPAGTVVGVDIAEDHKENTDFIAKVCPNFHLWLGDSVASARAIACRCGRVDILFVDTTHTFKQTMREWRVWRCLLSDRAVVCFDDLLRPTGMDRAWAALPEPKLRFDFLHDGAECGGGFGVVWRRT